MTDCLNAIIKALSTERSVMVAFSGIRKAFSGKYHLRSLNEIASCVILDQIHSRFLSYLSLRLLVIQANGFIFSPGLVPSDVNQGSVLDLAAVPVVRQ